jgi:hypothetical protein
MKSSAFPLRRFQEQIADHKDRGLAKPLEKLGRTHQRTVTSGD